MPGTGIEATSEHRCGWALNKPGRVVICTIVALLVGAILESFTSLTSRPAQVQHKPLELQGTTAPTTTAPLAATPSESLRTPIAEDSYDATASYLTNRPHVRVFTAGEGAPCFRIPAIVLTAKSTLLAFAEARYGPEPKRCKDSFAEDVVVKRSTTFGRTWESAISVVGSKDKRIGNAVPIALRSGRIVLFFAYHPRECRYVDCHSEFFGNGIVISDDDGRTWSADKNVTHLIGPAAHGSPGPGAGLQMMSGRIIVVSHMGFYLRDEVLYSDDEGETWQNSPARFPNMDEGVIAEVAKDELVLIMRHKMERLRGKAIARSIDGGKTWSGVQYHQHLIGPTCSASLADVGNGTLFFANPASAVTRERISIKASHDKGLSWRHHFVIECRRTQGYTSLVQGAVVKEKKLGGVLFEIALKPGEINRGDIDFTLFPIETDLASPSLDAACPGGSAASPSPMDVRRPSPLAPRAGGPLSFGQKQPAMRRPPVWL
mmetsp:Transcript_23447/g.43189  ORF Transcript_23447/g.43189 Transcript_23447/m.43189 type:complete len:489 (-) Transcript_23447:160-1626(-)